jgi:hypothetical protein
MHDDKTERVEVDILIKELAARPKLVAKPVTPAPKSAGAFLAAAQSGEVATAAPPSGPAPKRGKFVSEINLPPLPGVSRASTSSSFAINLPRFPRLSALGDLPQISTLKMVVTGPNQVATVRMWVGLAVLLAAAMPYWPYPKASSWSLLFYFFAVAVLVVSGIWGARLTWSKRLGVAHTVALAIVLWGITLAAEETIPRITHVSGCQ